MTTPSSPPTVEALDARLTALHDEVMALRDENARLRDVLGQPIVVPFTGSSGPRTSKASDRSSRRSVLGTGLKLAAGALGAGALLVRKTPPARAEEYHPSATFTEDNGRYAVAALATSADAYAIFAQVTSSKAAILADQEGTGPGVRAASNGNGVQGESLGQGASGVYGFNTNGGFGVAGDTYSPATTNIADIRAGVFGRNNSTGAGVFGLSVKSDGDGVLGYGKVGLHGKSTTSGGYGALIEGGKAQLRIVPSAAAGKPTSGSHLRGELFVDKNCAVYICTLAGTPGTWRMLSTTAV